MNKKLLFSLVMFSIVTVGLLIWCCGDEKSPISPLKIELTAAQEVINADDSAVSTIAITAKITGGSSVDFEITEKPTGSTASVGPATSVAVINGEATTELSAGTVDGKIVVKGTVEDVSEEVAVTVTAGTPAGIKAKEVNPIGVITCPSILITFTAQLTDAFGNTVEQADVSVTFSTDNGNLTTPMVTTDVNGQATAGLTLVEGVTAVVTATYINTVTFDPVTGGDPLLIPPTAAEIESEGPPSFRVNTAIIDPDTTADNKMGLVGFLVNEDLDAAMKDGTINLLYATRGLVTVSGDNEFMFVGVTGLCGAPAGPIIPCTGVETDYYIDPDSLDDCGYPLVFGKGTFEDGEFSVSLEQIDLGFPVNGDIIELTLCDINIEGKVTDNPWVLAGDMVESTYCPDGCASLSGFITKTELCKLTEALGLGSCELWALSVEWGDGECLGEEACSMRLLFSANEVTLYEVP